MDEYAELLVSQLGLEVGDLLAEYSCEVFWQHSCIDLISAIWFDDLLRSLLILVKFTAHHVH